MTDTNTRAALTELIEAVEAAHTDLFRQCCSNPIKNAWGKEVSVLKLNEAAELASRFKSVHAAAPSLPAGDGLTDEQILRIASESIGVDVDRLGYEHIKFARAILAAPRQPGEVGAGVHFRDAVEAMVRMLENSEWAEHVAATTGKGDPLAQRLEDAITNLINEANDGRELAGSGDVDGADRTGAPSVGVAGVAASAQQDEREARPVKITDEHFSLLAMLQISSCHCGAKTPDAKYHESACQYRLACEIEDYLKAQQVQADAAADAREILPGWEFVARNSGEWVILPPTGDYWAASTSTPTGDLISAIVSARAAMTDQRTGGAENTAAITANSAVNSIGEVRA